MGFELETYLPWVSFDNHKAKDSAQNWSMFIRLHNYLNWFIYLAHFNDVLSSNVLSKALLLVWVSFINQIIDR